MKKTSFLVLLCLCLILGACFATAGAEDVIKISNKKQLQQLVADVAADANKYEGKTVRLLNDIDLGGAEWMPIQSFAGEFDGNGKTISNFKVTSSGTPSGFFVTLEEASNVHDLTLSNVTATVSGWFGTLSEVVYGTVKNVNVKNVNITVTGASSHVAGMCAFLRCKSFTDSSVENLTITAENGVKHIAGFSAIFENANSVINNLHVKGFTATVNKFGNGSIAGFISSTQRKGNTAKLTNCSATDLNLTVSGSASGDSYVAGFLCTPGATTTLESCQTQGKIDVTGITGQNKKESYAGGFLADLGWNCLSNQSHTITKCSADVDIVTKEIPVGGFIGCAINEYNRAEYVNFTNCTAAGNVTSVSGGTASVGGFAGIADRGHYTNCSAKGLVSGSVAGGFIGTVQDVKPVFDSDFPAEKWSYPVNEIKLDNCSAVGTVLGTEKAGGLIGNVGKSLNGTAAEGAAGELIVTSCTAAPAVIGAKKSTQVAPCLNSTADSKPTKMDKLSGERTTANPTDGSKALAMDQNGNVTIPEGGADVQHTDDPELKWIPAGSIIHRDGSITLPGADVADVVTTVTPPKTGVDSADRFIPMALLSLLCMAALVSLRRKERRS